MQVEKTNGKLMTHVPINCTVTMDKLYLEKPILSCFPLFPHFGSLDIFDTKEKVNSTNAFQRVLLYEHLI